MRNQYWLRSAVACLVAGGLLSAVAQASRTEDTILAVDGALQVTPNALTLEELGLQLNVSGSTAFSPDSTLALTVVEDHPYRMLGARISVAASLTIQSGQTSTQTDGFQLVSAEPGVGYDYQLLDPQTAQPLFEVTSGAFSYDPDTGALRISQAWLRVTDSLAKQLGVPRAANNLIAMVDLDAQMIVIHQAPFGLQEGGLPGPGNPDMRAGGDVVYQNISDVGNHGVVGAYMAFSLGTSTCNIGNQNINWLDDGTPGVGFNAYKLNNGRLTQIGMGWVKTACCAAAGNGCGLSCNGQGGNVLGAGCLDSYSSGWNSIQSNLMSRSQINAFAGTFGSIPAGSGDAVWRRCQVATADMVPTSALYFLEGLYVGTQDSTFNNRNNNASYRRATVSGSSFVLQGTTVQYLPAILAWRANGSGVGIVDSRVVDGIVDVPSEGRFHTAYKVTDNTDGTWTYDYAIYNLSSDRSGGSFQVPIPSGVTVTNVGFNDVRYHSGDPFDNTDWTATVGGSSVTWASPQSFAQNPNSNALRWGTMYNFWFTANRPPADGSVTLGLFKPHTPQSVAFNASVPSSPPHPGDLDGDGDVDLADLAIMLSDFGCSVAPCVGDIDGDGDTDLDDLSTQLSNFGS
jgi:hypothetical protein